MNGEAGKPGALLVRLIGGLASLISMVLGGAGGVFFLSPALQKKEEGWVDLGRADSFKPNEPSKVEFVERRRDSWAVTERRSSAWVVASDAGKLTVFDPRCPHLGCPFRWNVLDKKFLCPCHTATFAVDGKVLGGPSPRPLDEYPVKVQDRHLLILPEAQEGGKEKS